MPTAQDIYNSLIQNPDYQGFNGLTREEVVEREARRRARQHANNEKALSMAVQNSAVDKLSHFINALFLQKELTDFDELLQSPENSGDISKFLSELTEGLSAFKNSGSGEKDRGWGHSDFRPSALENSEVIKHPDAEGDPQDHSIYDLGDRFARLLDVLRDVQAGLTSSSPIGVDDVLDKRYEDNEGEKTKAYNDVMDLFGEDGRLIQTTDTPDEGERVPSLIDLWDKFKNSPRVQVHNEGIQEGRAGRSRLPTVPIPDTIDELGESTNVDKLIHRSKTGNATNQGIIKDIVHTYFQGMEAWSNIPENEATNILQFIDSMAKITGKTTLSNEGGRTSPRAVDLRKQRQAYISTYSPIDEVKYHPRNSAGDNITAQGEMPMSLRRPTEGQPQLERQESPSTRDSQVTPDLASAAVNMGRY